MGRAINIFGYSDGKRVDDEKMASCFQLFQLFSFVLVILVLPTPSNYSKILHKYHDPEYHDPTTPNQGLI